MTGKRKRQAHGQAREKSSAQVGTVTEVTPEDRLMEVFELISTAVGQRDRAIARLDLLVAEARKLGGSWSRIARAADMTPQGAHGKWRRLDG